MEERFEDVAVAYVSPVQCLCDQCVGAFENANNALPPLLRQAVADGRVSPEINLLCVTGPLQPPYVSGKPGTIFLHITYLEMLWAFSYGMFVAYESEMREAMVQMGIRPPTPAYSKKVRQRASNLLVWSKGLHRSYTCWPADAPTPASYLQEEKVLTEKVNAIFLAAAAVILHHEFCHAAQGHMATGCTTSEVLEQEKEADDFAHHQFLNGFSEEQKKRVLGWSMLLPWLSCLYMINGPQALFQVKHPHVHHRIAHALGRLNFTDDESRDYFYGLALSAITTYMVEHGLLSQDFKNDPDLRFGFERVSDAFEHFLCRLDALNASN